MTENSNGFSRKIRGWKDSLGNLEEESGDKEESLEEVGSGAKRGRAVEVTVWDWIWSKTCFGILAAEGCSSDSVWLLHCFSCKSMEERETVGYFWDNGFLFFFSVSRVWFNSYGSVVGVMKSKRKRKEKYFSPLKKKLCSL